MKRFIDGVIFGAGFSIATVVILVAAFYLILPQMVTTRYTATNLTSHDAPILAAAPAISNTMTFLGSAGIYSGDFVDNKEGVLASGDGIIAGSVKVDGQPLSGLRLRLALNGSVMSQWATSDEQGVYRIAVPLGEYRIDGYELDYFVANKVLGGKINHPNDSHTAGPFTVDATSHGPGLDFRFIEPIAKRLEKSSFSQDESVMLKWDEVTGASHYIVQLYEKNEANSWRSTRVFQWFDRPRTLDSEVDLGQFEVSLKPGHFYRFDVEALDEMDRVITTTHQDHDGFDFQVTD